MNTNEFEDTSGTVKAIEPGKKYLLKHPRKTQEIVDGVKILHDPEYQLTNTTWKVIRGYNNPKHYVFHPELAKEGKEVNSAEYDKLLNSGEGWVDCTSKFPKVEVAEKADKNLQVIDAQSEVIEELRKKIELLEKSTADTTDKGFKKPFDHKKA